jgi:HD superfamily phosphodiesterase
MNDVRKLLETRFPGLHARIEKTLVDAEARYNDQSNQAASEFLLEHTRRTAAIAHKISAMEGVDPFLPALVALYHDAGVSRADTTKTTCRKRSMRRSWPPACSPSSG